MSPWGQTDPFNSSGERKKMEQSKICIVVGLVALIWLPACKNNPSLKVIVYHLKNYLPVGISHGNVVSGNLLLMSQTREAIRFVNQILIDITTRKAPMVDFIYQCVKKHKVFE